MNTNDQPPIAMPAFPATLLEGRFSGRQAFSDLVRQALVVAATEGWREIILSDPGFEDWPLGERAVAEALGNWAQTGRKFTVLAQDYGELARRHARFVTWRRTWAHIVECRGLSSASVDDIPSALYGPSWVFERLDRERCIGIAGSEPARRVALRERLNERLKRSSPAFPATTLGL